MNALGQHYDSDPSFEGIVAINETANIYPMASAGLQNSAFISMVQSMALAGTAAFPTSNVIAQNTWTGSIQNTYDFAAWMYKNRIAAGTPDTLGATGFENYSLYKPNGDLAWGLQAYMGLQDTGITGVFDMRSGSRSMVEIQAGDMGIYQNVGGSDGGPYTPTDIANAVNTYYQSSHAFWTHFYGTEQAKFPPAVIWKNLAPAVLAIPITHTTYPSIYP